MLNSLTVNEASDLLIQSCPNLKFDSHHDGGQLLMQLAETCGYNPLELTLISRTLNNKNVTPKVWLAKREQNPIK